MRITLFTFLFLVSGDALADSQEALRGCDGGDRQISSRYGYERRQCVASGYCYMYDYNPATRKYEYYHGYHSSCPGEERREVVEYTCETREGRRYERTEEGFWSSCDIR